MGHEEARGVAGARKRFIAMAASYFLGVFNDNFFKQAAMLLVVMAGQQQFQGYTALVFSVPFMLFAAPAGWLADKCVKRNVVIGAKCVELLGALVGAYGVISGNLWIMVGMVALMGTQATFFSPALNGSIPELYPPEHVTRVNAVLRMIITVGILVGISLSGFVLKQKGADLFGAPHGKGLLGICVILVALVGLAVSFGIPRRPPADPGRAFPWSGPLETLRELLAIWKDHQLGRVLIIDVFIWSVGVFQVLVINPLGLKQLNLDEGKTSLLVASQLVGLAIGGLLSARWAKGERWYRVLFPACLSMGIAMVLISLVPSLPAFWHVKLIFLFVALAGAAGGLLLIPCESFLQVRPPVERTGAVWASANFASFAGMAAAGALYVPLESVTPTKAYGVLGAFCLAFSLWMWKDLGGKVWKNGERH